MLRHRGFTYTCSLRCRSRLTKSRAALDSFPFKYTHSGGRYKITQHVSPRFGDVHAIQAATAHCRFSTNVFQAHSHPLYLPVPYPTSAHLRLFGSLLPLPPRPPLISARMHLLAGFLPVPQFCLHLPGASAAAVGRKALLAVVEVVVLKATARAPEAALRSLPPARIPWQSACFH